MVSGVWIHFYRETHNVLVLALETVYRTAFDKLESAKKFFAVKICCLDITAQERLLFQKRIDEAFEQCRESIGYFTPAHTYPSSLQEALLSTPPAVFTLGPALSLEESLHNAQTLRGHFPETPIVAFIAGAALSLRVLRRFESIEVEALPIDESPARLVHKLCALGAKESKRQSGSLIAIIGVKGGVGASSLAVGLTHSASGLGKRAVIVDLSPNGTLSHYLLARRTQSPEYSALLQDRTPLDDQLLAKMVEIAPNGISLLLPPTGGSGIRDLWLRDRQTFELSLEALDRLRDNHDAIICDVDHAEGVLPFAILSRAEHRLVVSSNDPASIHLLGIKLQELDAIPGSGTLQVVISELALRGLNRAQVIDYLILQRGDETALPPIKFIPFDQQGAQWVGTGNSFFTESTVDTQRQLENLFGSFFGIEETLLASDQGGRFTRFLSRLIPKERRDNRQEQKRITQDYIFSLPERTPDSLHHQSGGPPSGRNFEASLREQALSAAAERTEVIRPERLRVEIFESFEQAAPEELVAFDFREAKQIT